MAESSPRYVRELQGESTRIGRERVPEHGQRGTSLTEPVLLAFARWNTTTTRLEIAVIMHDSGLEEVAMYAGMGASPYSAIDESLQQQMADYMSVRLGQPAHLFVPILERNATPRESRSPHLGFSADARRLAQGLATVVFVFPSRSLIFFSEKIWCPGTVDGRLPHRWRLKVQFDVTWCSPRRCPTRIP